MGAKKEIFGTYAGKTVYSVTLSNQNGVTAAFLTFGATWHSYKTTDRAGNSIDVIVGPKTLVGYINQFEGIPYFFGSTVGRHAGRIDCTSANPHLNNFTLQHQKGIHLHGGEESFARQNWSIKHLNDTHEPSVTFSYKSRDMEGGYPGELLTQVTYTLLKDNSIVIDYSAIANADTLVNLTNHSYFNLSGQSLAAHKLYIDSNELLEVKPNLIPTGKLLSTSGTPYHFTDYGVLDNLVSINGLDDTFIFNKSSVDTPKIKFYSGNSGLEMTLYTDQPSVVVFTPKHLDFEGAPKNEEIDYSFYPAICFETQLPPDSINQSNFPSCFLKKNTIYKQKTKFSFSQIDTTIETSANP